MMEKGKTIGIWIRVSTEDQVKGESPEHHEKRARYYAESKEWFVKDVYRLEAVSGKSVMEHPETERMLHDIKTGKITGLIFSKLARLARNTKELLEFAEIFRAYNADLISLQESIDTSTPAGRLFYTMIAAMAQWEREEIAERVAASVPVRAKLGKPLGGQAPYGYEWKDGQLIPNSKEAPIRKYMYELYAEHKRKRTVERLMNQAGYRTRNGSKFSATTIERLIRDTTAKGVRRANYTKSLGNHKQWELKPEEEWVLLPVEPIISTELWNMCNQILDEQKSKYKPMAKKATHLFSGFVFCACGQKMYVPSNSPKYTCQKCRNKIVEEDLEDIYYEQLKNFFLSPEIFIDQMQKTDTFLKDKEKLLQNLLEEKSKIRSEMDKVVKLQINGELPPMSFRRHYEPLEERFGQIESQVPEIQGEIDLLRIQYLSTDEVISEAQDLYKGWKTYPYEQKRTIVEIITQNITIGSEDISINLNYAPPSLELMTNKSHNFRDSSRRRA